jgi:hypothetical protein
MNLKALKYSLLEVDTRALELFILLLTFFWSCWLVIAEQHTNWPKIVEVLHFFGGYLVWTFWGFFHTIVAIFSQVFHYPKYRKVAAMCTCFYWSLLSYCLFSVDRTMLLCWFAPLIAAAEFYIVVRRFTISTGGKEK